MTGVPETGVSCSPRGSTECTHSHVARLPALARTFPQGKTHSESPEPFINVQKNEALLVFLSLLKDL